MKRAPKKQRQQFLDACRALLYFVEYAHEGFLPRFEGLCEQLRRAKDALKLPRQPLEFETTYRKEMLGGVATRYEFSQQLFVDPWARTAALQDSCLLSLWAGQDNRAPTTYQITAPALRAIACPVLREWIDRVAAGERPKPRQRGLLREKEKAPSAELRAAINKRRLQSELQGVFDSVLPLGRLKLGKLASSQKQPRRITRPHAKRQRDKWLAVAKCVGEGASNAGIAEILQLRQLPYGEQPAKVRTYLRKLEQMFAVAKWSAGDFKTIMKYSDRSKNNSTT